MSSSFSSAIKVLVSDWERYRSLKTTDKNDPIHRLVIDDIRSILIGWTPNADRYLISSSVGQGNISRTPWFATFDKEVTTSATSGYYLVYLLSADLKTLVLELGFGAGQFENHYGRGKKLFAALDNAVIDMRRNSEHLVEKSLVSARSRVNTKSVLLSDADDFLLKAYEHCSIYSLVYEIDEMPTESEMKDDYLEFLVLYRNMCESLLLAEVDSYVYELIDIKKIDDEISSKVFVPRLFSARGRNASSSTAAGRSRHSKKSDKVGKLGEEIVVQFERDKLLKAGMPDFAARVNWHREDGSNRTPGWDVSSFDLDGREMFIEVKASEGRVINDVELTVNEWNRAQDCVGNDQYFIYLVTDVFSSPAIEILRNPAKNQAEGKLTLEVSSYRLFLGNRPSS